MSAPKRIWVRNGLAYLRPDNHYPQGTSYTRTDRIEQLTAAHKNMCDIWAKEAAEKQVLAGRAEKAEADLAAAVEAGIDVTASLVAAISLLERGGKKAAPSDKMFAQMLIDYSASIDRFRSTLARIKEKRT